MYWMMFFSQENDAVRTRIKICGLTQNESIEWVAQAGVDAIGFVFYPPSKRFVSRRQAQALRRSVPSAMTVFGVFVNAEYDEIMQTIDAGVIDCLQFHGSEPESFCAQFPLPYVKAIPMGSIQKADDYMQAYLPSAQGFLLDSHGADQPGGTGRMFQWQQYQPDAALPVILSGGLTVENVGRGIQLIKPYAVDVSSGVEDQPAHKSHDLIQAFVAAVRVADQSNQKSGGV